MGCGQSTAVDKAAKARSDAIDQSFKVDRAQQKTEVKMLLLGAGESGKSTVLKQMRLCYGAGYDQAERESYREIIYSNTIQSMAVLLKEMANKLDLQLDPANQPAAQYISSLPAQLEGDTPPAQLFTAISALWQDPNVKVAFERRNEFQLNDSAGYYFDNIFRKDNPISSPTYVPTVQDILQSRVKTTGILETTFRVQNMTYKLFDVGGQRSERKKWIHCFENVTAIVFLVALSEFDQGLYEDDTVYRLREALDLFKSICNSRWFVNTHIILFLNKTDLFKEKLKKSKLADYLPEYTGDNSYADAAQYIHSLFQQANAQPDRKTIYTHFTCATDTTTFKVILGAVNDMIIQANLRDCGLL